MSIVPFRTCTVRIALVQNFKAWSGTSYTTSAFVFGFPLQTFIYTYFTMRHGAMEGVIFQARGNL